MKRAVSLVMLVAATTVESPSLADPKDACIVAYEQTQTAKRDGKLVDARAQAALCARPECDVLLTKDCARWMRELDASIPSVVLEARTPRGTELTDVHVTLDGAPLVERLDGKGLDLDPGKHVFRFERRGASAQETVLVREGERNRRVRVVLGDDARGPPGEVESPGVPTGVFLFGGAAIVAFGVATAFAIDGFAKKNALDECKPRCAPSDVDAMSARFTVADVALGAGVMAAVAATYLFLTRPAARRESASRAPIELRF